MKKAPKNSQENGWEVPWIHGPDWKEVLLLIEQSLATKRESRAEILGCANNIAALYKDLESPLNRLCKATCPSCTEVCCMRATVWYDQRDLLVYYILFDSFPESQITKDAKGICCHLGKNGCKLDRLERPFICTWYLCRFQSDMLRNQGDEAFVIVQQQMKLIKENRKRIGSLCL